MSDILLESKNLKKNYFSDGIVVPVIRDISLSINVGESLCVVGSSGSGKSTLLHMLGTLDKPTEGSVHFRDRNLAFLKDDELSKFRNQTMGFVFQFHHLLADFTAQENVAMPLFVAGVEREEAMTKASTLLGELGLGHRLGHRSSKLSGGEQQRVAIARAIVRNPAVVFADEPTGNLDRASGLQIQDLLFDLQKSRGLTLVVVTHDQQFASRFQRTLTLADGVLTSGITMGPRTL